MLAQTNQINPVFNPVWQATFATLNYKRTIQQPLGLQRTDHKLRSLQHAPSRGTINTHLVFSTNSAPAWLCRRRMSEAMPRTCPSRQILSQVPANLLAQSAADTSKSQSLLRPYPHTIDQCQLVQREIDYKLRAINSDQAAEPGSAIRSELHVVPYAGRSGFLRMGQP